MCNVITEVIKEENVVIDGKEYERETVVMHNKKVERLFELPEEK